MDADNVLGSGEKRLSNEPGCVKWMGQRCKAHLSPKEDKWGWRWGLRSMGVTLVGDGFKKSSRPDSVP